MFLTYFRCVFSLVIQQLLNSSLNSSVWLPCGSGLVTRIMRVEFSIQTRGQLRHKPLILKIARLLNTYLYVRSSLKITMPFCVLSYMSSVGNRGLFCS